MIEKPEFTGVNEDFEIIFNAVGAENVNRAKDSKYRIIIPECSPVIVQLSWQLQIQLMMKGD